VVERHVGVALRYRFHRGAPKLRRLEDVGLVHRRDLAAARAGELECDLGDPLDLLHAVAQRVDRRARGVEPRGSP